MIKEIKNNELYFDGCSTTDLAKQYGTPLYVMSETGIKEKIRELKKSFLDKYPNTRIAYACKAFCTTAMCKICDTEGLCIDVVSGGELYTAKKAGFPAERIEFNGNNKLRGEIEDALDYGIGRFIVDSEPDFKQIEEVCKEKNMTANILLRITPGVAASTHDFIITGKRDSKFGVPLDEDVFYPLAERAIKSEHINLLGLHFHIGSQILDNDAYLKSLDVMLGLVEELKKRFGYDAKELNLGGGFGVKYTDEQPKPYSYYIDPMMEKIESKFAEMQIKMPAVVFEPGRSIVAEAGLSLYTIGNIKDIRGVRKYIAVDGGMADNIRPALYEAVYDGVVANKADEPRNDKATICGKTCESGDILIRDCAVTDKAEKGDLFAIFSTGAYGFSMASNYNNCPIPAVVLVREGKSSIIVKRQSYEHMTANHEIPEWL